MKPALNLEVERPLTRGDLARLVEPAVPSRAIERLSQRHHLLARYIAQEYTLENAAILAGYSISAARALVDDPSFADLISFYSQEREEVLTVLRAKLEGISMEAADELLARLEDPTLRAKMSNSQLESLAKTGLDRLGLGVKTTQETNVNVNIAARLDAARKRLAPKVIEHE